MAKARGLLLVLAPGLASALTAALTSGSSSASASASALASSSVSAAEEQGSSASEGSMNPIRKVVTLLQNMQKKVTAEGEAEEKLYEEFMCFCTSGKGELAASIASATAKGPAVSSDISEGEAKLVQSKADLKAAQEDRSAAKAAVSEANALREKEAAVFASEKAELDTNIAALKKAIAALQKGMAGSFLQSRSADVLRKLATSSKIDLADFDRTSLTSFLAAGGSYAPQSGEITGILEEIVDTMSKSLAELTSSEETAVKNHEGLLVAKQKEIAALSETVEAKTSQIGELGVSIVRMKADLSDTQAALLEDQKFMKDMESSCSTKTAEWEERSKTRADELVAIADVIKVLNDDDALDLFKQTLPSGGASLVQVHGTAASRVKHALSILQTLHKDVQVRDRPALDLLALSLGSKRAGGGFDKVITMIEKMVEVLKKEQVDDDSKKEYCQRQLDHVEDKQKAVGRTVNEKEVAIESAKEGLETVVQELQALELGIKELDKSVAEATEQRKKENEEYGSLMASDRAAKELLQFAINRLNKFYSPSLHKEAPKRELSEEERIFENHGGAPPTTEAPGGIAGTGVTVLTQVVAVRRHIASEQDAPAPPPATWSAYAKKGQESNGVIAMIDLLVKDLDKEMTEAETNEKLSQKSYEELMQDSAEKRAADTKSLTEKSSAKADLEGELQLNQDDHMAASKELMAVGKYMQSLHAECDWLLQYAEVRQQARADEVDALKRAKAVLNGADYSLLQKGGFLLRRN